ncbi:MAG: right-handed parallel beta-helix repeat-containing protein [Pyrinomonadaceae bacterium]
MSTVRVPRLLFLFASVLFLYSVNHAQATRTWISGVGDDVNPCSRTAPCKTLAGAISRTATGGEINCLDPGGFGALTIVKSITLDCTGTQGSILASSTSGIIINAPNATVNIRSLSINGAGTTPGNTGIRIISAGKVFVETVLIEGFSTSGVGILCAACQVSIKDSTIRNINGEAISASPATGTASVFVADSLIAGNRTGIGAVNSTVRISGNSIVHNTTGLLTGANGSIVSYRNNVIDGNGTNGSPTSVVSLQ